MTFWRDKVVVVTGGSAGLGLVLSQSYAAAGCQVVIASRNENQGRQAVESIGPKKARFIATDVTDADSVSRLVEQTVETYGKIDVWM